MGSQRRRRSLVVSCLTSLASTASRRSPDSLPSLLSSTPFRRQLCSPPVSPPLRSLRQTSVSSPSPPFFASSSHTSLSSRSCSFAFRVPDCRGDRWRGGPLPALGPASRYRRQLAEKQTDGFSCRCHSPSFSFSSASRPSSEHGIASSSQPHQFFPSTSPPAVSTESSCYGLASESPRSAPLLSPSPSLHLLSPIVSAHRGSGLIFSRRFLSHQSPRRPNDSTWTSSSSSSPGSSVSSFRLPSHRVSSASSSGFSVAPSPSLHSVRAVTRCSSPFPDFASSPAIAASCLVAPALPRDRPSSPASSHLRFPLSVSPLTCSPSSASNSLARASSSPATSSVSLFSLVLPRYLRHRVLPSSLPNRLFSVENRETARFWPPPLEKEEEERRGAFLESISQKSGGKATLLHPPQYLPRAPSHVAKLLEEEERYRLYRHLKKEERDAASLNKFGSWLSKPIADTPAANMRPLVGRKCRETMRHLQETEMERLDKQRNFQVPLFGPGDLMEVKYELSRSQQTFATFQGYCVEVRKKRLNSSFVLRNSYEGIGVEQRIPLYSPRIISLKVVTSCASPTQDFLLQRHKPLSRDYRYKWKYNFRGRWSRRIGKHKPGIRSVEKKIRQRIVRIRKRYMGQRIEAGLPPYVWGGPYPQYGRKRSLFIRGEMYRRMLIYSFDERRRRAETLRKRRAAVKWGVFKLRKPLVPPALTALPTYHPLYPGNLPK